MSVKQDPPTLEMDITQWVDVYLPPWARRTNPIVHRHLGIHWKVMPVGASLIGRVLVVNALILLCAPFAPFVQHAAIVLSLLNLVILPIALWLYVRLLVRLGVFALRSMIVEVREGNFLLLRLTPLPLRDILYGKIAATVWRQIEDLSLVLLLVSLLIMPGVVLLYEGSAVPSEPYWQSRLILLAGMGAGVARLMLEPLMIVALALLLATVARQYLPALIGLLTLVIFYYVLINMMRLLPIVNPWQVLIVDFLLPVILPALITMFSVLLTAQWLQRD